MQPLQAGDGGSAEESRRVFDTAAADLAAAEPTQPVVLELPDESWPSFVAEQADAPYVIRAGRIFDGIGDRYGYRRPEGGFFLWLDVSAKGTDETVTAKLWRDGGLRVIPGHYLARDGADGRNPGTGYIRVALVQDKETTAEALHRLVTVLG